MCEIKYIAAGFLEDAEKLLDDFIRENSTKFSVFAYVWRKQNFSLVFMGRGSEEELREFTQEIFYLSTKLLTSSSWMRQVGVVYLLYALFRNQVLSPLVRIRVVSDHVKLIQSLRDMLPVEEHKTFHHVVSYLTKNSFDFVASPKLMGPTVPSLVTDIYKGAAEDSILKFHPGLKSDMTEMAESKVLKETGDMFAKYVGMKSSLNLNVQGIGSDTVESFETYRTRLSGLLDRAKTTLSVLVRKEPPASDIGLRRAYLKSKAFGEPLPKVQQDQRSALSNDDELALDIAIDKPLPLRKRFPKPRRNVGRPKKVDKDDEDVSLNKARRRRRPRKPRQRTCTSTRHYYSETEDLKLLSNYENLKFVPNKEGSKLFTDDSDDDSENAVAASFVEGDCVDSEPAITTIFVKDTNCDDSEPVITTSFGEESDCDDPKPLLPKYLSKTLTDDSEPAAQTDEGASCQSY